ncbi:hypothetical protein CGLO_13326 [Colletotrichum gloeosporioides Cg-14]|uniref:Uncharacterized protein n=1 Tax=Colletotrichum gloeosporioides (strain Cg-14) TaxID=1237896 RepID=T0K406_COLGC|nr:hypothetical protein CGLO_13326 [Colletotrichum gloeosporioides Cg-14]
MKVFWQKGLIFEREQPINDESSR